MKLFGGGGGGWALESCEWPKLAFAHPQGLCSRHATVPKNFLYVSTMVDKDLDLTEQKGHLLLTGLGSSVGK